MGRFWGKLYCFMRKYAYVPRNSNKKARNKTYGNLHMGLLRLRLTVFGYFGKRTFFLRFPKKIRVLLTGSVLESFSPVSSKSSINGNTMASLTEHALC